MDERVAEIEMLLRNTTVQHIPSRTTQHLDKFVSSGLEARAVVLPSSLEIQDVVIALLFESALRAGPTLKNNDGEPATPLLAAKHLLALGQYPESGLVPDTGLTLDQIRTISAGERIRSKRDPRESRSLGLRSRIAGLASGYGTSRGVFRANSARLRDVASALHDEMQKVFAEPVNMEVLLRLAQVVAEERRRGLMRPEVRDAETGLKSGRWKPSRGLLVTLGLGVVATLGLIALAIFLAGQPRATNTPPSTSGGWDAAWGPSRAMFAVASGGAPYPVFNSISDNPNYGDERNFVTLKPADDSRGAGGWTDEIWANPGDEIMVRLYGENSGSDGALGVAAGSIQDARVEFFSSNNGSEISIGGVLSSVNSIDVWDGVTVHTDPGSSLRFDPTSAQLITNAQPQGVPLVGNPFEAGGALIGQEQDGVVPPGYEYSFYVIVVVTVESGTSSSTQSQSESRSAGTSPVPMTISELWRELEYCEETVQYSETPEGVRLHLSQSGSCWSHSVKVDPTIPVQVALEFKNKSEGQVDNVVGSLKLDPSLSLISGTTYYGNSRSPAGAFVSNDRLDGVGVNVGSYAVGANAWWIASISIDPAIRCGPIELQGLITTEQSREADEPAIEALARLTAKVCDE